MPPRSIPLQVFMTPPFLSSLRTDVGLPPNTWYIIAATTLSILNRPDQIPYVFKHAINSGSEESNVKLHSAEQLKIARRMREALVKASAIGGLPKTINALLALKAATPADLYDQLNSPSPTSRFEDINHVPIAQVLNRGQIFFDKNYGKVSKTIMDNLDSCGTEDLGLISRLVYGHIVSNTKILSAVESSYVLLAGLIPQDVNPQLKGHLKGALNHGATVAQVRAARDATIRICEAAGMQKLADPGAGGWGWKSDIATL